jgi:hypothetical protein
MAAQVFVCKLQILGFLILVYNFIGRSWVTGPHHVCTWRAPCGVPLSTLWYVYLHFRDFL